MIHSSRFAALTLAVLATAFPPASAPAESLRSAVRVSVGPPSALYAMPGVDSRRSRQSLARLSSAPRVERRLRIAFGIGRGLVVLEDGGIVVVHPSARASRFDALGKLLYSVKLSAEASSPPVVTSSGLVAFVTKGELVFLDDGGRLRFRARLGVETNFTVRSILSTRDGGVLVASGTTIYKVSAFADLEWQQSLTEPVLELLEAGQNLIAVSDSGAVYGVGPFGKLSRLGELGGATGAVVLAEGGRSLLARTGDHRIASFDLSKRRTLAAAEDPTLELGGPVLLTSDQHALAFTKDGFLVRFRPDGSEVQRVPVDQTPRRAPGNDFALLLGDARLLLVRAAGDVVLVSANGEVSSIPGSACPDPLGAYPAAANRVLIACQSGNILGIE